MKVIGISGLPGSGKSYISAYATKINYEVTSMGDVIREEAEKRGEDTGTTAKNLRLEQGEYVVAKLTIEKSRKLIESGSENIIVEGIRSPYEVEMFRDAFPDFTLLSVFASPRTRFSRISQRARDDDTEDINEFRERDQRELNFGIGSVVATSDFIIINEDSFEEYQMQIDEFFNNF